MTDTKPVAAATPADTSVDIFSDFALNPDDEKDGVWVSYRGNVEFKIAYAKNRKFKDRASYYYKKNAKILDGGGSVARDKLDEVTIQVMSEAILLDWKGDLKFKGEVLQYSPANARILLSQEGFREWVSKQSDDMSVYKAVKEAEDEGN